MLSLLRDGGDCLRLSLVAALVWLMWADECGFSDVLFEAYPVARLILCALIRSCRPMEHWNTVGDGYQHLTARSLGRPWPVVVCALVVIIASQRWGIVLSLYENGRRRLRFGAAAAVSGPFGNW